MQLKNKKFIFLGDSITEGVGVSNISCRFANVFQNLSGCEAYVDGIGGTRFAKQKDGDMTERANRYFVSRVSAMPTETDYVVVFGGTNDFGHGNAPFGEYGDTTIDTFYGAIENLCCTLVSKFPSATIVFMTPLHRLGEDTLVNDHGLDRKPLIEYVNAIKRVCQKYSLPVLDLYSVSGIQPSVPAIREMYMPDGLHPNDAGAEKIAKLLYKFIRGL